MSKSFGELFKEILIANKLCREDGFEGCSPQEIENLRLEQGVKRLPKIYREFLEVQGKRGLGHIFQWGCRSGRLKEDAIRNRNSYDPELDLPEDMFVFFGHHDYDFHYFRTDNDDDNPPVYRYLAESGETKVVTDTLTEYFNQVLQHLTQGIAKLDEDYFKD